MPAKVSKALPQVALERILRALEEELVQASDEEILDAARDLGMNPRMKGSAAFFGIRHPARPRLSEFVARRAKLSGRITGIDPAAPAEEPPARRPASKPRARREEDES